MNSYESNYVSYSVSSMIYFNGILQELKQLFIYLTYSRIFFVLAVIISVYVLIKNKEFLLLGGFSIGVISFSILISSVINFEGMYIENGLVYLESNYATIAHDTWGAPLRLLVFGAFLIITKKYFYHKYYFEIVVAVFLFSAIYSFFIIHQVKDISQQYVNQVNDIIDVCRENEVSKAIVLKDNLTKGVPIVDNIYQDVLVYSSLDGADGNTVQVIYIENLEDTLEFFELKDNQLVLGEGYDPIMIRRLNANYFEIEKEQYKLIELN